MQLFKYLALPLLFLMCFSAEAQNERFKRGGGQEENRDEESRDRPQAQSSQEKPVPEWREKLVFGGAAGLGFGTNTNILLAPQVGYRITDNWIAGVGYLFNYTRVRQTWDIYNNFVRLPEPIENTIQGPNVFTNFFPFESIFVGAQAELLTHNLPIYDPLTGDLSFDKRRTPVLFLQGGYRQQLGQRSFVQIGLRINVLHSNESPYLQSWAPIFLFYF